MNEYEELISKLAAIEAQIELMQKSIDEIKSQLQDASRTAIVAQQSSKSAHHRITTMYAIAGAIGGAVAFVVDLFKK